MTPKEPGPISITSCIFAYATTYQSRYLNKDKAIKYCEQIKINEALKELLNSP